MTEAYKYKAFISYSHTDKVAGDKLLKELENYRVPKRLVGKAAAGGTPIPNRVGQIFRDRDELPAAEDLTTEVKKALTQSEFMIVLCSPAAAASRWVNREIIEFKKLTGERRILSVILSGEPFASGGSAPEQECFPPALRFKLGTRGTLTTEPAEPLAADFRAAGDGPRRGKLKLVAGLLGIGLDALIERDLQRKMRRVMAVTAASVLAMIGMASLTYEAVTARQDAERHRGEAEGLIEFMLTDLRDKLEPVGRLDVLDAVGEKAVDYYDRQALDDMPDDALGRRARAFHLLGEIDDKQGDLEGAREMFEAAYKTTAAQLAQNPDNPDRIFDHSQSAYWVGYSFEASGDINAAFTRIEEYDALAKKLTTMGDRPEWINEYAYAESSLGTLYLRNLNEPEQALAHFTTAQKLFLKLVDSDLDRQTVLWDLADASAWMADAHQALNDLHQAVNHRAEQLEILTKLQQESPNDWKIKRDRSMVLLGMGKLERIQMSWSEANTHFKNAAALTSELTNHDSSNVDWRELFAVTHLFWSEALLQLGDIEAGEANLKHATKMEKTLVGNDSASNSQFWEILIWRQIIEIKILDARGLISAADLQGNQLSAQLETMNNNNKRWHSIRLKDELALVLDKIMYQQN